MRVLHLLATGKLGGAQGSAADVMVRFDPSRIAVEAVSLTDGPALRQMRRLGLAVTVLDEPDDRVAVRRLADLLRARRTDLLHAHMYRAELLGARAAWRAGTPAAVATVHSSRVRSPSDVAALASLTPLFNRLIVPSEAIAAKVRREGRGAAPVSVIPNGVDLDRFATPRAAGERAEARATTRAALGVAVDAFLVGVVARLEPEKGHRHLLAAWPEIAEAVPNAWLLVVGDGSLTLSLHAQARALPADAARRVAFAGARDDVPALTRALDLAVLPSLREAQGIALLEAMAARLPVVASAVGGIPEMVRHDVEGLLVPSADPDAMSAAVRRLAGDPALRQRLGNAGRRRAAARYAIGSAVSRIEAVYDDALGPAIAQAGGRVS